MDEMERFRAATAAWATGGLGTEAAVAEARGLAAEAGLRTIVLVEGSSDRAAVEALAGRTGRDLDAERVAVVPLGGATSIGRFLDVFGPGGLGARVAGLCDAAEEEYFRRALERAGLGSGATRDEMGSSGFFVCVADLEEELIRSLGAAGVEQVIDSHGDLRLLRTFQNQPAQRTRTAEQQLRRFLGTTSGRKISYGRFLVDGLDLGRIPRPLELLLEYV